MIETTSGSLGRRLRRIRQEKGLTLKQIEARVGVSATHISEVERGNTSPTIGALEKIAEALGVVPSCLIDIQPSREPRVLHSADRRQLTMSGAAVLIDPLTDRLVDSELSIFIATIQPNGQIDTADGHPGEEFCYVLEGILEVVVNDASYILRRGDTLHFRALRPHRIRNLASTRSRALCAVRPRLFI